MSQLYLRHSVAVYSHSIVCSPPMTWEQRLFPPIMYLVQLRSCYSVDRLGREGVAWAQLFQDVCTPLRCYWTPLFGRMSCLFPVVLFPPPPFCVGIFQLCPPPVDPVVFTRLYHGHLFLILKSSRPRPPGVLILR